MSLWACSWAFCWPSVFPLVSRALSRSSGQQWWPLIRVSGRQVTHVVDCSESHKASTNISSSVCSTASQNYKVGHCFSGPQTSLGCYAACYFFFPFSAWLIASSGNRTFALQDIRPLLYLLFGFVLDKEVTKRFWFLRYILQHLTHFFLISFLHSFEKGKRMKSPF